MSLNDVRDFRWIFLIGKLMANKVAISKIKINTESGSSTPLPFESLLGVTLKALFLN